MSDTFVSCERRGNVLLLTLNRPERLNALRHDMRERLNDAVRDASRDDDIGCIVLTGAGRAFSSGADMSLGPPATNVADWYLYHEDHDRNHNAVRESRKPVIAAINGICYGAGLILAAHCDLLIASDKARFSLLEARMGSAGASVMPFHIGPQWAKYLILTGEAISAQRAKDIGLILEVVDHDQLESRVLALAQHIANMPARAVQLNKKQVDATMDIIGWSANEVYTRSQTAIIDDAAKDAKNVEGEVLMHVLRDRGVQAFVEARDKGLDKPWLPDGVARGAARHDQS
jgi:enoyl-CoA hydratase/carnithine racemase